MKSILASIAIIIFAEAAFAQKNDKDARTYSPNGIRLGEAQVETWEFGLNIIAHGATTGITASVPIPIEWPEQGIEIVEVIKPDQVKKVTYKSIGNGMVKQMVMVIPRMGAGDEVEVKVVMRIKKHFIQEPEDTSRFVLKKAPSSVRKYLLPSPYIASNSKRIKALNKEIGGTDLPAWEQVEHIYDWVRKNVEYKFDKQIRTCAEALDAGHGDCEELSSIFIAVCRARGIPARAVWIPEHTYPEFYLQDNDGKGHWFPCQAAGMYEFGGMSESKPVLQKGDKFKVPNHRKHLRYVQPTLAARDAAASPQVQWIMRKVE